MASEIDTSAEAVERLAAHITGGPHEAWEIVCASTLRALAAERDAALTALRAREEEVGRLREALVRLCAWGRMTPSTPDERSAEQREGWGAFDQARAALATPAPEDAA